MYSSYTYAQNIKSIFIENTGLQIGMYQGQTDLDDSGYNYYFRLYNQHIISEDMFGELSLSSGNITGLDYRSRLTPIEYRVGFYLSRFGVPEPTLFNKKGSFYTYLGLGVLYNKPIEIAAPNDPLTVEMGNRLPTSSFWSFDGGFAPIVPFGLGMDIQMDENSRLNITAGYNPTLQFLKFNSKNVPRGYWGLSIGFDFGRKNQGIPFIPPMVPQIMEYRPMTEADIVKAVPVKAKDVRIQAINYHPINFAVLSSIMDANEQQWLKEVAQMLKQRPDMNLFVRGHADASGTNPVNVMISQSRARAVWLTLIDLGIEPKRMQLKWYSDLKPIESNESEEGRFKNRRVELHTTSQTFDNKNILSRDEIYIASIFNDLEQDKPLFPSSEVLFEGNTLEMSRYGKMLIKLVAYLMLQRNDFDLMILSMAEVGPGNDLRRALSKARAEWIRAQLIKFGIEPQRLIAAVPGTENHKAYGQYIEGDLQQNVMIPIKKSNNTLVE